MPVWAAQLSGQMNSLLTGQAAIQADIQDLKTDVQDLKTDVQALRHRTSLEYCLAREDNAAAALDGAPLVRVPHPDTGALPPPTLLFPATRGGTPA